MGGRGGPDASVMPSRKEDSDKDMAGGEFIFLSRRPGFFRDWDVHRDIFLEDTEVLVAAFLRQVG